MSGNIQDFVINNIFGNKIITKEEENDITKMIG
jgi:hypothetical protein